MEKCKFNFNQIVPNKIFSKVGTSNSINFLSAFVRKHSYNKKKFNNLFKMKETFDILTKNFMVLFLQDSFFLAHADCCTCVSVVFTSKMIGIQK